MADAQNSQRAADTIRLVDIETWKRASAEERQSLGPIKACAHKPEPVKEYAGETDRILRLVESTPIRDRHGDRVMQDGWQLEHYRKNPVGLWMHDHWEYPINRALYTGIEEGNLVSYRQFPSREENPDGYMVYNLLVKGYLNASSVGFRPLKWDEDPDATDEDRRLAAWGGPLIFFINELLESSIVTVPANPEALIQARAVDGIDLSPYVSFAERILDGEKGAGLWVPRDAVERLYSVVAESRTTSLPPHRQGVNPPEADGEPGSPKPAKDGEIALFPACGHYGLKEQGADCPVCTEKAELERQLAIARGELTTLDAANGKRLKDAAKKLALPAAKVTDDGADLTAEDQKRIRAAHSKLDKVVAALAKDEEGKSSSSSGLRLVGADGEPIQIIDIDCTPQTISLDMVREALRAIKSPAAG